MPNDAHEKEKKLEALCNTRTLEVLRSWWSPLEISEPDQKRWCNLINQFAKKYKPAPKKTDSKKSRKSRWSPERRLMFFDHYLELQGQYPDKSYEDICILLKDHALWKGELPSTDRLRNLISEIKTDLNKRGMLRHK